MFTTVRCPSPACNRLNRVRLEDIGLHVRCGQCGRDLDTSEMGEGTVIDVTPRGKSFHIARAVVVGVASITLLSLGFIVGRSTARTTSRTANAAPYNSRVTPVSLPSGTNWKPPEQITKASAPVPQNTPDEPREEFNFSGLTRRQPDTLGSVQRTGTPTDNRDLVEVARKFGGRLITPEASTPVRLRTGQEWDMDARTTGRGELVVDNGTAKDGVAVLFAPAENRTGRPRRAVYVRHGEKATVAGVDAGTYSLRFVLGTDWNEDDRTFRRDVVAWEFEHVLTFSEVGSRWLTTLHTVADGTDKPARVSPELVRFKELERSTEANR
jgi:hypothetical protein